MIHVPTLTLCENINSIAEKDVLQIKQVTKQINQIYRAQNSLKND